MREVLLGQPELQVALHYRAHTEEANPRVAQFVGPGNFSLNLHWSLALRKLKADQHFTRQCNWARQADSQPSLAEVHEMSFNSVPGSVAERYRQVQRVTVIAQPAVENHVACRGKRAHRLLHRDRL